MSDISKIKFKKKIKQVLVGVALIALMIGIYFYSHREVPQEKTFSDYSSDITEKRIKKIIISTDYLNENITVHLKDASTKPYKVTSPHLTLEKATELSQSGVEITYPLPDFDYSKLLHQVMIVMIVTYMGFMLSQLLPGGFSLRSKPKELDTKFSDVAGAEEAKLAMQEIVHYLHNPKDFEKWGAKFPSGILLCGPPGNGKTLLARAVAGEAGASFLSISAADFNSPFIGIAGIKIKRIFSRARAMAPCVLFIDEIDSIGGVRMSEGSAAAREMGSTLTQLLVQMDGFEPNSGVVVVAATNRVDTLDGALLRSGRFDRNIQVHAPNLNERKEILQIHSKNIPISTDFDFSAIARATIGMNGADLSNLMNQAALLAKRDSAGDVVNTSHGLSARNRMLMGEERAGLRALLDVPTRRILATHEASHAVVCMSLNHDPVTGISILPRGHSLGQTMMTPSADRVLHERMYLLAQMRILIAGRVGEEYFEGACTTGAENDIVRLTSIAKNMVNRFGMGALGMICIDKDSSSALAAEADREIMSLINEAYADALNILTSNKDVVISIARQLYDREDVSESETEEFAQRIKKAVDIDLYYRNSEGKVDWLN